ncbi:MAG: SRPBCC domain-containing protein, partial [Bacteroidota bacterium]
FVWVFSFSLAAQSVDSLSRIHWPAEYEPGQSKFYVHNEIEIAASPEVIWEILMDAEAWPDWYKGAKNVELLDTAQTMLSDSATFKWKTMGLKFQSTIQEFVPPYRLSWESRKKSIRGYHAWLIIPQNGTCKVITDESQNGWLTFFEKIFQRKKLHRLHDVWLSTLKTKAEAQQKSYSASSRNDSK